MFMVVIVVIYIIAETSLVIYLYDNSVSAAKAPSLSEYDQDFFPNFLIMLSVASGVYEGITLTPTLFSNARY